MGQQPNIELRLSDLPRPTRHPAAPQHWTPDRPGEVGAPADMPWGGMFGTPGPDSGYALRLAASRPLALAEGENRHDAEAAVAALMGARASHHGRAPTAVDAEVAELLLGYAGNPPDDVVAARKRLTGLGHSLDAALRLVAAVSREVLAEDPESLRRRLESGERLLDL